MAARYWVNLYDVTGHLQAVLDTWDNQGLTYQRKLDNVGNYSFTMSYLDKRWQLFKKDCFFEVIREDLEHDIAPYRDFIGFHRDKYKEIDQSGKQVFRSVGVSLEHLLKRRHILYFAETVNAMQGPPGADGLATPIAADDAMKAFVDQNAGVAAFGGDGVIGRIGGRDGTFPNFTVAPSTSDGALWAGARQYQNLLDVCREIALATQMDFDVTLDHGPSFDGQPLLMTFNTYVPFLGINRSDPVGIPGPPIPVARGIPATFSPQNGTMLNPKWTETSQNEITVAMTLGAGQLSDRQFDIELNDGHVPGIIPTINDSPWNDIEHNLTMRMDGVVGALSYDGDYAIAHTNQKIIFTFDLPSNSNLAYGRDWNIGDFVSITWNDIDGIINRRITGAQVTVGASGEQVTPDLSDIT